MQQDLNRFSLWCKTNKLILNVDKCKYMPYYRKSSFIDNSYLLFSDYVKRIFYFKDLGVTFSFNLSFNIHIDNIVSKAYSMLGLVKRFSKYFCDPYTIKNLYVALVRSQLIYACTIWFPSSKVLSNRIESVQKRFLVHALRMLPRLDSNSFVLAPYLGRCRLINLSTLDAFHKTQCALLIRDIICSKFNCPELLSLICFYVPSKNLRPRNFISLPFTKFKYGSFEPLSMSSNLFNSTYNFFDFNLSRNEFRDLCLEHFSN